MRILDPISVAALVGLLSRVLDSAAGEAGKQAWGSLTTLIGRLLGRRSGAGEAAATLDARPGDPEAIKALAEALAAEAGKDPSVAAELRGWLTTAERAVGSVADNVSNTVTGEVHGPVVQARDIHGGIRFG